jgi:acetylornithine deacetylase
MDNEPSRSVETAARDGDPVALARLLVSIPSVNPVLADGGAGEREIAKVAGDLLREWGLTTEIVEAAPGRPNVVATLEGAGPTLLLNGHLDTVGVSGMTVDPFGARLDGDRLIGRGACDMKAGVAALMAAACRLARGGPRPRLVVALTSDEEHASLGMASLVGSARAGTLADLAVVCEPTSLKVMPAHKGFVWIRATFRGRAAHGSRPQVGVDAIRHAGLYLAALDAYAGELGSRPPHPLLGHGSFHAGTIAGGSAESVYPDRCELLLERRTLPGESADAVLAEFQAVLDTLRDRESALDATLETTLARPGTEVSSDDALVRGLLAAGVASGVPEVVEGMTAWVDAAFLNEAGVPAVCYGPGSIEQAHTVDEWVDVREIRACANALERFARSLAIE